MTARDTKRFHIAFSFAGEKRAFVEKVADSLAKDFGKNRILYDKYHEAEFARERLGPYLAKLYVEQSDLVVLVFCAEYDRTPWTGCEWSHILGVLTGADRGRVMLCRFDQTAPSGLSRVAGFVELDDKTPEQLAQLVRERLALNQHAQGRSDDANEVLASSNDLDSIAKVDISEEETAFRVSLKDLHPVLLHDEKLTEELFDGNVDKISDDLMSPLIATISALKKRKRRVEVISAFSPVVRPIADREDFTAALLTDLVLQHSGHLKWFIRKTSNVDSEEDGARKTAQRIWVELAKRYLNRQSSEFRSGLQEILHRELRSALQDKPNLIYRFFQILWPTVSSYPEVVDAFVEFLKAMRSELADAKPSLLTNLIVLQGQGERLLKPSGTASFAPKLVEIPPGGYCGYAFEAMRAPLTNREHGFLCGTDDIEDRRLYEPHLLGPWEWQTASGQEHRYPQVAAEIRAILESCEYTAHRSGYRWRVPTVAEWLRLAGCESQSYPWGETPPTADQTNLRFRGMTPRVKPVESYPKGRSTFDTYDCCGNIHELAWANEWERLPDDSRLMGGCYLTRPEHSSCRRIRLLSRREPDLRRNVGLRLVRVPDHADRWSSLPKVLKALQVVAEND
ncbi:TIR domain-containing protein [Bradyrhizobium sp. S3.9.1]|uniref:TIR domain-containing protein n=1 Tax=Bradyrhizobium sp. S3.9.1 TaxID=3156431 RepID=UPI0033957038